MAKLADVPARPRASIFSRVLALVSGDTLVVALAVFVAAITRLTYLDLAEFKGDESHVLGLAALLLDQHVIPLIGIVSSVGINNPPIFVYLMTIPLLVSRDPAIATGFIGLFGVGAVALCYHFCVTYFDRRTARVAALLFAASPFAIVYDRKLQAQDVVPFFTLLWMGALFGFARDRRGVQLVGVAFWLSVLIQLHQASVALIPITVLALAVTWGRPGRLDHEAHERDTKSTKRENTKGIVQGGTPDRLKETRFRVEGRGHQYDRRLGGKAIASITSMPFVLSRFVSFVSVSCASWSKRPGRPSVPSLLSVATAFLAAGIIWVPYLIFQLTHDWADLRALLRLQRQPATISFQGFGWVVELASGNGYNGLTGIGYPGFAASTYSFDGIYLVERLLLYVGFAFLAFRLVQTRGRDWRYLFLLLWLVVPPLFFIRSTSPLYPHYFLDVYPTQFILIGLAASAALGWVETRRSRWRPIAVSATGILLAAIVAAQVYGLVAVMDYIARAPTLGGHGVPLRQRETAIDHLVAFAAGSTKPVEIASGGDDYPLAFAYLADHRVRQQFFDDRDTFVSPADDGRPTLYLTSDPNQPVPALLRQDFPDDRIDLVPFPGQTTGFEIYRLPPDAGQRILADPSIRPIGRTAPNGIRLVGYRVAPRASAGEPLRLALYWQIVGPPPKGHGYAFFNHLIDGNGRVWGQQDGMGYDPAFWKPGDVGISWFTLETRPDLPAEVGWIETGIYDRAGIKRLPLRAADGSTSDRVLLGPIKLVPANPTPLPPPIHRQEARFGSTIDLVGYDLDGNATPGGTLSVALTWSARATPDADYTSFVHLLDPAGRIVAQSDGPPGVYPTSLWEAGDTARVPRAIALPKDLVPGTYHLEVGLYRRDTMARLVTGSSDHLILDTPVIITK